MYCLLIAGKPIFYSANLEQIIDYANILRNENNYKRASALSIIEGFDPKEPKDFSKCKVLYRRCTRCMKIYSTPYFLKEDGKMIGSCLHCRGKRKQQYTQTYLSYNPKYVDDYIAEKYGSEYVSKVCWHSIDEKARPTNPTFKGSNLFRPPYSKKLKEFPLKEQIIIPKNVWKDIKPEKTVVSSHYEPIKETPTTKTKRWSYHFLCTLPKPFVSSIDWFYDFDEKVTAIQKGLEKWTEYSLICYANTEEEADEKIKQFKKEHKTEINAAKIVTSGNPVC